MRALREQIKEQRQAASVRVIKPQPHALGFLDRDCILFVPDNPALLQANSVNQIG